ncbi:hypothetical protein [Sphingomonas immobilis]|uniref:Uncharacterized protein n=1 Tax=Sphingomonas immobilis TaxID=3063997 RepID=A0ABT8ZW73_9SPHN|nr:hypothetical protein [Sphingomonas sp. CA1-15]MDO7841518.1 hypothetical protein [Sphingomonas sp. CA1-15]
MATRSDRQAFFGDIAVACLLALVLGGVWALRDWPNLSALRLPDTDDVMRLQQIRDWLAGQRFADLSQHRLGGGLAMHWSRLADLVPGAIIAALTPLTGAHAAELTAVIVWPGALFAVALALVARIARGLDANIARTAIVVAAIAYPATTIFLPGRIDHHGLQVVLLLVAIHASLSVPTLRAGVIAGAATAASLVVGLETAPLLGVLGALLVVEWLRGGTGARLLGFGIGTAGSLLAASFVFHTDQWLYPACDGFTATAWRAEMILAVAPVAMVLAGRHTRHRLAVAAVTGAIFTAVALAVSPACLSPYGAVDPLLKTLWLGRVGEAQALFSAPLATAFGYAGVMTAGTLASAWQWRRTRDPRWAALFALQLAAVALTCVQLRGAYAGAILAAPALAAVIAAARARGAGFLAAAWLGSAGMIYPIAAQALTPAAKPSTQTLTGDCTGAPALARLATLPPGRLLAPLDLGAWALPATKLDVVGAPYHRNNAGNLAVYHFFLGSPDQAAAIASRWRVRYVAVCDDSFAELPVTPRFAGQLRAGHAPAWLRPLGHRDGLSLYEVAPAS